MTLRTERTHTESKETNDAERAWWNENAELISRVWEMHPEVSWGSRAGYLRRAKRFFLRGRQEASVLELGCGSGWVGQFIAGPELRIVGTDQSESQISLAVANAAARGLDAFCRYSVVDTVKLPCDMKAADGVLIHAFMHHLDGGEVAGLLDDLAGSLLAGTRLWFYEPAFYRSAPESSSRGAAPPFGLRQATWLVQRLSSFYRSRKLLDESTMEQFNALMKQASESGWYVSPKEVPFVVEDFSAALERRFRVAQSYWATVNQVGWAYETNLIADPQWRKLASSTVVPLLRLADENLARDEGYLRAIMVAPNYAFRVWECELS